MTGGLVVISIIGICIGLLCPAGRQDALITEDQSSWLRLPNDLPLYRWREKLDAHPVTTP